MENRLEGARGKGWFEEKWCDYKRAAGGFLCNGTVLHLSSGHMNLHMMKCYRTKRVHILTQCMDSW